MNIRQRVRRRIATFAVLALSVACGRDMTDDPIPYVPFSDFVVSLVFPEYTSLRVDGGFKELNNLGVRGVILYRKNENTYFAFERNCSYHPNDACATVNVHSSLLYMNDPCCGSSFNFADGAPSGGVAWRPLRQYRAFVSGGQITITSEVL